MRCINELFTVGIIILVFGFVSNAFGQEELPQRGNLSDIISSTKCYINANEDDREKILNLISKNTSWTTVSDPEDADFFIEYKELSRDEKMYATFARGQMDVYTFKDDKKVVVWSRVETGGGYKSDVPGKLVKKFVKDFEKYKKAPEGT